MVYHYYSTAVRYIRYKTAEQTYFSRSPQASSVDSTSLFGETTAVFFGDAETIFGDATAIFGNTTSLFGETTSTFLRRHGTNPTDFTCTSFEAQTKTATVGYRLGFSDTSLWKPSGCDGGEQKQKAKEAQAANDARTPTTQPHTARHQMRPTIFVTS